MKLSMVVSSLCLIGAALLPLGARAQFGGGGMPPGIMHKIQEWKTWRSQHKNLSNLGTMVYQLQQLEQDSAHRLNKVQAHKLLVIMQKWSGKKSMTEAQAHTVQVDIGNILTLPQIQKMTTYQMPWANGNRGGGGGGGFGGGKPGKFVFPDPPKGGYNPLNPATLPFVQMRPQAKKSMAEFVHTLAHS